MTKEMTLDGALKEMKDLLNAIEKAGMGGKECDISILRNIGTDKNPCKKVFVIDSISPTGPNDDKLKSIDEIYDTVTNVAGSIISGGFRR